MRNVQITETPTLKLRPDRLAFQIMVNNKLPRVFRGQGIVLQFTASGQQLTVDQSGAAPLAAALIPPGSQQQVTIYGPSLGALPPSAAGSPTTIGLFLYDVVTATDGAGNPTQRQNFEWYFSYGTTPVERAVTPARTRNVQEPIGPTRVVPTQGR